MNDPRDERLGAPLAEQLRGLLADAVSDVEPSDSLDSLRHRTKVTPMNPRRPWLFAVGGAVVATAAVITAIAFAGGGLPGTTAEPGPAGNTTTEPMPPLPTEEPTDPPTASPEPPGGDTLVTGIYYVGDTPSGPRLYREFSKVPAMSPLEAAVELSLAGLSQDPDYRSAWPQGSEVTGVGFDGIGVDGEYTIVLQGVPRERPAGMDPDEATMAVEALIYTVQAAGQTRAPVEFLTGKPGSAEPVDQILGVPTSEPLSNGPVLQTLALVSLTTPTEGQTVTGDTLEVSGVANSFEANVVVRLQRFEGTEILFEAPITAEGWMGEKLFPFSGELDISDVPPGTYLLVASTDDPSGGAEGGGSHTDSKLITVK